VEHGELTLQQLYNTLLAGKRVAMQFATSEVAEAFRIKLHKYKSRQDQLLEGIGMQPEEARAVLSFTKAQAKDSPNSPAVIILQFRQEHTPKYEVVILEEEDKTGLEDAPSN